METSSLAGADSRKNVGPIRLLSQAWKQMRRVSGRLLLLIVTAQLVIAVVGTPLIAWIFKEALRAGGMYAIDTDTFALNWGFSITLVLLFLILLIVMWLLVMEFSAIVILLQSPTLSGRQVLKEVGLVAKKALTPKSWLMAIYLVVVLPLSGFGFTSVLLSGVRVPNFITGELQKDPLYSVLLTVAYLAVTYLNIRLSLTLPLFALSPNSGNRALKESWKLTGGLRPWPIVVAALVLIAAATLVAAALFYVVLLPTMLTDAIAPDASWVSASIGLGSVQIIMYLVIGYTVAFLAGTLTAYAADKGAIRQYISGADEGRAGRRPRLLAIGAIVVACAISSVLAVPTLRGITDHPETMVLAHRGWTEKGVENSIESLEAAAELGVEFVEFDTMRTADGQYVVIHDTSLGRLAGTNQSVKDMTLDELTATEIYDSSGHTALIPSLVEYGTAAKALDQPLLIELKISGAEPSTEENVADLLSVLEENDLLEGNIFHSLDHASVEELKRQRPDLTVGYIMPFAGVAVPETSADFLVLEESAATAKMQQLTEDADLGYFVWTVDNDDAIRLRFREGVDAIISDRPQRGLELREAMNEQTGLAGRLHDIMLAFMKPF